MSNNWLIGVAALLIGAAGGYMTGRGSGGDKAASTDKVVLETKSGRADVAPLSETKTRPTRAGGLEEIRRTPGQMNRLESLMDYIAGLDPSQFESEAEKLDALPWQERIMSAFLLFSRWGEVDPLAALDYSSSMGFAGMFARPSILQSWASVDPENAAKYYAENPNEFRMMGGGRGPMGGQNGASVIAGEWARNDPEGALAWAQGLEGRDRSSALSSVLREIATTDPAAAAAKLATLTGDDLGRAYNEIAQQWGAKDWDAAQAWIRTLPAEEQTRAMSSAIEGLARQDVAAAARQVEGMPADQVDNDAVEAVAQAMARNDPASAASWIAGLDVEDTGRAMRDVMVNWTVTDPAAALGFVESQPAGEVRDQAAATYVWSNRDADPASSIAVAESISDEGSRERAVTMTAVRWMREDETAARAYVESSTVLSDEAKERVLSGEGFRGRGGPGGGPPRGRGR